MYNRKRNLGQTLENIWRWWQWKQARLETHRSQFESLKMKEKEDIASYLLQVDGFVNTIKCLGEKVNE